MSGVEVIVYGLSALIVTVLLIFMARRPAEVIGLVDRPGGRKQHEANVPLCGGPAMVGAFLLLALCFGALPSVRHLGLLAGVLLLALVGLLDDLRDLRAAKRFIVQILIVLLCLECFGSAWLASLGDLFGLGDIELGIAQIPFTIFCVVCLINAFNFVDGIDGLAGGLAVIALNCFAGAAFVAGRVGAFGVLILLIGGAIGFLLFNLRTPWRARASAFLGDSGSTALGFILCWFAIDLTQGDSPAIAPITAVWILALPIMDTVNVVLKRALRGHGLFRASRDHLHHALLAAGFTPGQAVPILLGIALIMGAIGLAGQYLGVRESVMCLGFMALFIIYYFTMRRFWRRRYRQFVGACPVDEPRPAFGEFLNGACTAILVEPAPDLASLRTAATATSPSANSDSDSYKNPMVACPHGDGRFQAAEAKVMRRPETAHCRTRSMR